MEHSPTKPRNIYVKRVGRKLRKAQQSYLEHNLPVYDLLQYLTNTPEGQRIDLQGYFKQLELIWLEIGFGSGEHLIHQAKLNPNAGLIGCEVFLNGVASLLGKLQNKRFSNIGLFTHDVRDLFDLLPDRSMSRVFLLYPDPWPKKRHYRRRFVNPDFLNPLARIMTKGAELRIATDIPDYCRQAIEELNKHPQFNWPVESMSDWQQSWPDWHSTRYEQKAIREGRKPIYMTFIRI